jgi:hypothetical protein
MWLIACVLMAILFAYDAKWFLLPFSINIVLIVVGVVFFALGRVAVLAIEVGIVGGWCGARAGTGGGGGLAGERGLQSVEVGADGVEEGEGWAWVWHGVGVARP